MLDIKFVRDNPEIVKQNIRTTFQDKKLPLVDEVLELDKRNRNGTVRRYFNGNVILKADITRSAAFSCLSVSFAPFCIVLRIKVLAVLP